MHEDDANRQYYLDPGTQKETVRCLDAVSDGEFLLLVGARASGKSTRLLWLRNKLEEKGYFALWSVVPMSANGRILSCFQ
jgi:energy-coupling factor transporter ATP-binding protein EcfA2